MIITNSYFEYAGVNSSVYGLKLLNLNTSSYDSCVGNIESASFYNRKEARNYLIDEDYTDSPIEFEIDIICDSSIPAGEVRKIEKWLFGQKKYAKLYFDNDIATTEVINGVPKRLYLNCRFKAPEKIEFGRLVGWKCVLECDSCMAWQDPTTVNFTIPNGNSSGSLISIDVDTDINDYVYPYVTLTIGSTGGSVSISNHSDDSARLTSFTRMSANTTFYMNGAVNYVSGDNYEKFVDRNFVRLLDGTNSLSITGNVASISFTWQNMRYL